MSFCSRQCFLGLTLALGACPSTVDTVDAGALDASTCQAPGSGFFALEALDRQDIQASLPTASYYAPADISPDRLGPDDIENANTQVWALYDDCGVLVGFYRDIFTPIHCVSGACQAVYFAMVFAADGSFADVLHPSDSLHNIPLKYMDGEEHPFNDDDWDLLRQLCAHPPAVLLGVEDTAVMVADATETAPTVVAYQDVVVRGAAFTSYQIVMAVVDTKQILRELFSL